MRACCGRSRSVTTSREALSSSRRANGDARQIEIPSRPVERQPPTSLPTPVGPAVQYRIPRRVNSGRGARAGKPRSSILGGPSGLPCTRSATEGSYRVRLLNATRVVPRDLEAFSNRKPARGVCAEDRPGANGASGHVRYPLLSSYSVTRGLADHRRGPFSAMLGRHPFGPNPWTFDPFQWLISQKYSKGD